MSAGVPCRLQLSGKITELLKTIMENQRSRSVLKYNVHPARASVILNFGYILVCWIEIEDLCSVEWLRAAE